MGEKRKYTEVGFVYAMAFHVHAATGDDREKCKRVAADAYREHMEYEELEFGDPAYAWDFQGAKELASALILDHCEARP